jgi:hypothetical protein
MKKSRILGYALTLAATLFVGSAMGQVAGGANFVKTGATDGDVSNHKSFITKGKTLGFYALPDDKFHPGYTATNVPTPWTLTAGFTWNWTIPVGVTAVKGPAMLPTAKAENYVELTSATPGTYAITVKEKSSAAFGGCEDATGKTFDLVVFDTPTIDFENNLASSIGARPLTEVCGTVTGWKINLKISASDYVTAKFKLEEIPVTITAGAPTVGTTRTTTTYNTTKLAAGNNYTKATGDVWALSGIAFNYDTDVANRALVLSQTKDFSVSGTDVITLYRYTVEGVSDFVTRKSDNGGTETLYTGTAATQTIDIYVKRAPVTGPVYHINNNIAK